jgi:hypothetical protein
MAVSYSNLTSIARCEHQLTILAPELLQAMDDAANRRPVQIMIGQGVVITMSADIMVSAFEAHAQEHIAELECLGVAMPTYEDWLDGWRETLRGSGSGVGGP